VIERGRRKKKKKLYHFDRFPSAGNRAVIVRDVIWSIGGWGKRGNAWLPNHFSMPLSVRSVDDGANGARSLSHGKFVKSRGEEEGGGDKKRKRTRFVWPFYCVSDPLRLGFRVFPIHYRGTRRGGGKEGGRRGEERCLCPGFPPIVSGRFLNTCVWTGKERGRGGTERRKKREEPVIRLYLPHTLCSHGNWLRRCTQ